MATQAHTVAKIPVLDFLRDMSQKEERFYELKEIEWTM
jgi:hypothetical protein